jgi:hypothetical protein
MRNTMYRRYVISYEQTRTGWRAQIRRPGGYLIMRNGLITATAVEGEDVLLSRCRERIDEEEGPNTG